MTEEEKELHRTEIDPKGTLVASAMFTNPGSLRGKLKAIWMLAASLARQAEEKHGKKLRSLREKPCVSSEPLHLKAKRISLQSAPLTDSVVAVYTDLLATVREIEASAKRRSSSIPCPQLSSALDEAAYINALLLPESMSNKYFLDQVVPHFFALQLHCYRMYPMLEFRNTVPVDPKVREERAAQGGKSKTIGEDILREKFSEFLASKAEQRFPSKAALFRHFEDELYAIVEDYRANNLHRPHPITKRMVNYSTKMEFEHWGAKFLKWSKDDQQFSKRLELLLSPPLKEGAKASEGS